MIKKKMYKYIGRNGTITSPILLEDAKHIDLMELRAEEGYILTDGTMKKQTVIVHIDDVDEWSEIKADTNK